MQVQHSLGTAAGVPDVLPPLSGAAAAAAHDISKLGCDTKKTLTPPARHPYDFPYPPYPLQVALMDSIFNACAADRDRNKNRATLGLLESPTGTGKTMSMVCALVAFLQKHRSTPPPEDDAVNDYSHGRVASGVGTEPLSGTGGSVTAASAKKSDSSTQPAWVRAHAARMIREKWESDRLAFRESHALRVQRMRKREENAIMEANAAEPFEVGLPTWKDTSSAASSRTAFRGAARLGGGSGRAAKRHRGGDEQEEEVDVGKFSLEYTSAFGGGSVGSSSSAALLRAKLKKDPAAGAGANSLDQDSCKNPVLGDAKKLQVIVCSRTHSQLSQFCGEIAKFLEHLAAARIIGTSSGYGEHHKDPPIRVVSLASRMHGCTNPKIPKNNATQCNEACQTLRDKSGCKYKAKSSVVADEILAPDAGRGAAFTDSAVDGDFDFCAGDYNDFPFQAAHRKRETAATTGAAPAAPGQHGSSMTTARTPCLALEDIIEHAKTSDACAYYGARDALPEADFILVPYSCILHAKTREALGLDCRDNIVVFDEAHNVFDACADAHSSSVQFDAIEKTLEHLTAYETKYAPVFGEDTKNGVAALKRVLEKLLGAKQSAGAAAGVAGAVVGRPGDSRGPPPQQVARGSKSAGGSGGAISTSAKFLLTTGLDTEDLGSILTFIQQRELCRKLRGFAEWHSRQVGHGIGGGADHGHVPHQHLSGIYQIVELLNGLVFNAADDRVLADDKVIKLLNLDVEAHLFHFLEEARAVLFLAGTLEPRAEFAVLKKEAGKCFETAADHIVPVENTFARVVTSTSMITGAGTGETTSVATTTTASAPTVSLDFRATRRLQEDIMRGLKQTLDTLEGSLRRNCNRGCGMVVFFPSFEYLSKVAERFYKARTVALEGSVAAGTGSRPAGALTPLTATGAKPRPQTSINKQKDVFVERQGLSADALLSAFGDSTKQRVTLLFAVVGGRVSEGINFKDDMCRCVCVVGMPYPNPQDPVLQEKMRFLDARNKATGSSTSGGTTMVDADSSSSSATSGAPSSGPSVSSLLGLAGKDYYQMRCMKAVNQCIGRAIRHKDDWAAMFLLDHRYASNRVTGDISGWLRSRFQSVACDCGLLAELDHWFQGKFGGG